MYKDAIAVVAFLLIALLVASNWQPANGHSFYPKKCCSDQDCAPATVLGRNADGGITLQSKFGTRTIPSNYQIQASPDGRWHLCINPEAGMFAEKEVDDVVCVFGPVGV